MFVISIAILLITIYFLQAKRPIQSQYINVIEIFVAPPKLGKTGCIKKTYCWGDYIFGSKDGNNAVSALWNRQNTILPQAIMLRIVAAIIHEDYP